MSGEEEPEEGFIFGIGETEYLATPDNTSLFTFAGQLACYDHVFHAIEQEGEVMKGVYIFSYTQGFLAMQAYMMRNNFPAHTNLRSVADCDKDAFDRATLGDLRESESYPEAWDEAQS